MMINYEIVIGIVGIIVTFLVPWLYKKFKKKPMVKAKLIKISTSTPEEIEKFGYASKEEDTDRNS